MQHSLRPEGGDTASLLRYITDGLRAFQRYRTDFFDRTGPLAARLSRETVTGVTSPETSPARAETSTVLPRRPGRILPALKFIARLPRFRRQAKRIAARTSAGNGTFDAIIAVAGRRLFSPPFAASPRRFLVDLLSDLGREDHPTSARRQLASARDILVFDPLPVSKYRDYEDVCEREGIAIVDGSFLLYTALTHPLALAGFLLRAWLAGAFGRDSGEGRRSLLAAFVIDWAYRRVLRHSGELQAFFLTSNSFATEVLRLHLLVDARCTLVCEVQHGVPPAWEETYFRTIIELAEARGGTPKHVFVPQISGLPGPGVFARRRYDDGTGINPFLNNYLMARQASGESFTRQVAAEWQRAFPDLPTDADALVVSFPGTIPWRDFNDTSMSGGVFDVERAMLRCIKSTLSGAGRPFVIIYTPHPALPLEAVRSNPFFVREGITIHDSTVFTWFTADVCVALYSSTLFEAQYFGVDTFTPVIAEDGIYDDEVLAMLAHPSGPGRLLADLREFIAATRRTGPEDAVDRAVVRLSRAAPFIVQKAVVRD